MTLIVRNTLLRDIKYNTLYLKLCIIFNIIAWHIERKRINRKILLDGGRAITPTDVYVYKMFMVKQWETQRKLYNISNYNYYYFLLLCYYYDVAIPCHWVPGRRALIKLDKYFILLNLLYFCRKGCFKKTFFDS